MKHARNSDAALFWIPAFAGMTSCPPFDCAQDRLRPGIQCSCSLGNPLRTLLRQRANYTQSSFYLACYCSNCLAAPLPHPRCEVSLRNVAVDSLPILISATIPRASFSSVRIRRSLREGMLQANQEHQGTARWHRACEARVERIATQGGAYEPASVA